MPINPESLSSQNETARTHELYLALRNMEAVSAQIGSDTQDAPVASAYFKPVAEARPAVISVTEAQQRVAAVHESTTLENPHITPIPATTAPITDMAAYQRAEQARQNAQLAVDTQPAQTFAEILAEAQRHAS